MTSAILAFIVSFQSSVNVASMKLCSHLSALGRRRYGRSSLVTAGLSVIVIFCQGSSVSISAYTSACEWVRIYDKILLIIKKNSLFAVAVSMNTTE